MLHTPSVFWAFLRSPGQEFPQGWSCAVILLFVLDAGMGFTLAVLLRRQIQRKKLIKQIFWLSIRENNLSEGFGMGVLLVTVVFSGSPVAGRKDESESMFLKG